MILASGEAASQLSPPLPHGWIGTTSQWIEGFGIGLVVLNVILLALVWRRLHFVSPPLARRYSRGHRDSNLLTFQQGRRDC